MITDRLIEHPWMSPVALVVLVVAGPLVGRWLVGRTRLAWVLFAASMLPVLALTLVPTDRQAYERCAVQWALPTPGRVELMANVVLFVAPTLLLGVALRRPWLAIVAGVGFSAGIELTQSLATAIGRSCDTTDWLSNAIGALIGGGLAWIALRTAADRDPDATEAPAEQGLPIG